MQKKNVESNKPNGPMSLEGHDYEQTDELNANENVHKHEQSKNERKKSKKKREKANRAKISLQYNNRFKRMETKKTQISNSMGKSAEKWNGKLYSFSVVGMVDCEMCPEYANTHIPKRKINESKANAKKCTVNREDVNLRSN